MTTIIKLVLHPQPDCEDIDVRFGIDGKEKGFGFTDKDKTYIALVRCPMCEKENYAMNVITGVCSWCGFSTKDALPK